MSKFILAGFSGTHGVGKTTVSQELQSRKFRVDTNSLPRAAQAALGWDSLRRVEESEDNMWAMQDHVLKALNERDRRILSIGEPTFVDRTPVDFAGYVHVWASRLDWNINRDRYKQYMADCALAQERYCKQFFFPIRDEIEFVPEINRGDLESREQNQNAMVNFMIDNGIPFHLIQSLDIHERADEVLKALNIKERQ